MSKKINLTILGVTGSIGDSTLKVVDANPDRLAVVAIAGNTNIEKLAAIAKKYNVKHVSISDEKSYKEAVSSKIFDDAKLYFGNEGLVEISCLPESDMLVAAVMGTTCLKPTLEAINCGKDIALANKELLVMAGKFVTEAVKKNNVRLLPLDSEHNAIFQCLNGERKQDVDKLIITASGGMFRDFTLEQMQQIQPKDALVHPNWNMGPKVTIDSSTLANKGLEVIEAKWLFDMSPNDIEVVVHRQSIIHSMVRFIDGSILAHLSPPNMTFAISHSILYPERGNATMQGLDFTKPMALDFTPPDVKRFPCLKHAFDALRFGKTATCAFNASNEVAVENFIKGKISWLDIATCVGRTLEAIDHPEANNLEELLYCDAQVRIKAQEIANSL